MALTFALLAPARAIAVPVEVGVVLVKRGPVAPDVASEAAQAVERALGEAGVRVSQSYEGVRERVLALGLGDGTACEGKRKCVFELSRQLRLDVVVAVSVAALGNELAVHAEALDVSRATVLAEDSIVVERAARGRLAALFAHFGTRVTEVLSAKEPAAASTALATLPREAPRDATSEQPPPVVAVETGAGRRSTGKVLLGVGLGGVVLGGVVLGVGAAMGSTLTPVDGMLPRSQLETYRSATTLMTVGGVAAGLGALVAGVGAVLWRTAPAPAVQVAVTPWGDGATFSVRGDF